MKRLEPRLVPRYAPERFRFCLFVLLASLTLSVTCSARELSGAWLSPDWFFPGGQVYTEQEVRATARDTLEALSDEGVDTVFLETFLRGYSICPSIARGGAAATSSPHVVLYKSDEASFPVYPHLSWKFRVEGDTLLDPLQIFIEEGQMVGVEVHAWVHLFYWRMDNNEIMLPWHNGPSVWGSLMETYLRRQSQRLGLLSGRSVRPGFETLEAARRGDEITPALVARAADIFAKSCDTDELSRLLRDAGIKTNGHPMGALVAEIVRAGGERPDFLLVGSDADPFPAPRGKVLRPIYVDPEHPLVRQKLHAAIKNIAENHPGLAGIHLDHVRYPVDGQGLASDTGVFDGSYHAVSASDRVQLAQYDALNKALGRRREALQTFVKEVRDEISKRLELSAAVLPLYYRDHDDGSKYRTSGYDYSSQAWMTWPVDYVVPMMYEYHPYLIRTLVKDYQSQANVANPAKPILVYPGISHFDYTRNGGVDAGGWVFFDLSLSRDVKAEARETEDLDFGGK